MTAVDRGKSTAPQIGDTASLKVNEMQSSPRVGRLSGSFSSRSTQSDENAGKSPGQQPSRRIVMQRTASSRSKSTFSEAQQPQPLPNTSLKNTLDVSDADCQSIFSTLSESAWTNPVSEAKSEKSNRRQVQPSFSSGSLQGVTIQTGTPVGNGAGRSMTKIKASDLGIKLNKNPTQKEIEEAVRKWKAEQQKSKELLGGTVSGDETDENDSQQRHTRKITVRRGLHGSASQLGKETPNDPSNPFTVETGVEFNGDQSQQFDDPKSALSTQIDSTSSQTPSGQGYSPAPVGVGAREASKPRSGRSATPGKNKARAGSKSPAPARGITPSRRRRHSVGANPKGRELSKSPARGSDYRPVSWRPEDSSMHKEDKQQGARRAARARVIADEHSEIQRRLREAGISLEQYRAMLGVGLTIGLA